MTSRITPSVAPRLWFHCVDADGAAKTDLAHTDFTSAKYRLITGGVAGADSSAISLSAAVYTSSHSTGSMGPVSASDGWYFIDAPVGAADAAAEAVELVIVLTDGTLVVYPTRHVIDVATSTRNAVAPLDSTATQSAAAAAIAEYDPPTKAELDTAQSSIESHLTTFANESEYFDTVVRTANDTLPIYFDWPIASATITVTRSINGAAYEAATGTATYERTEAGAFLYTLSYDAADRPESGVVSYLLSDGTYDFILPLAVTANFATETSLTALSTKIGTPVEDTVAEDIAQVYSKTGTVNAGVEAIMLDTQNLVTRIPSALFSGITSLAAWLGTLAGKTADASTLGEIQSTTAGATFTNITDSMEAVRDRGDDAWASGGGGGEIGTGANTVAITVTDADDTIIVGAKVRLTLGVDSYLATTDGSGIATLNVDDGSWVVAITKPGYSFAGATLVVNGDETQTYVMSTNSITPPASDDMCVVYTYFYLNSKPVPAVTLRATVTSSNNVTDPEVLSLSVDSSLTNKDGYAELQLVRSSSFSPVGGTYLIEIVDQQGKTHFKKKVKIPDADSASLGSLELA